MGVLLLLASLCVAGTSSYTCKCPPETTFTKEMYEKEPDRAIHVCYKLDKAPKEGMVGDCDAPGVYVCKGPDADPTDLKPCPHCALALSKSPKSGTALAVVCHDNSHKFTSTNTSFPAFIASESYGAALKSPGYPTTSKS